MKTKQEGWQLHFAYENLEKCESNAKKLLGRFHGVLRHPDWRNLEHYLRQSHHYIYRQFRQVDEDGFRVAGKHPFDVWASKVAPTDADNHTSTADPVSPLTPAQYARILEKAEDNVHSLSAPERRLLLDRWAAEIQRAAADEFVDLVKDSQDSYRNLMNVHEEVDRRVLQGADVIGLTTTGLAKSISTLQRVRCKIVLCEEAGEVMEAHILSAMLPHVEHFIQIGDHQQLRPTINNFKDLSLESTQGQLYQLDRSQFERLSVGHEGRPRIPVAQLNVQRRMRPEISKLIRNTMYERLVDHESTTQLPNVVGMRRNSFWLDHEQMENIADDQSYNNKSKSNDWEVTMVHALVRHVIRQGSYKSSEIAVLTPYTGQLQKLRLALRNDFEIILSDRDQDALLKDGFDNASEDSDEKSKEAKNQRKPLMKKRLNELLRAATVDNFQGEEAKIIIVSLVRSNNERKVGFLRTTNRINVLLSRAQHGMYLVGNSNTYANVPMWNDVIGMLRADGAIGHAIELCCPRHPDTPIQVRQPDDFSKVSPEGGCCEPCMDRLPDCGHGCKARCHSQAMHEVFKCEQKCQRRHKPCDHLCQKATCGEECGLCMVKIEKVELPCGHIQNDVPCFRSLSPSTLVCLEPVKKTVPGCGHIVQVKCATDVIDPDFRCMTPCGELLGCGHRCPGTCHGCSSVHGEAPSRHEQCVKVCGRGYGTCNHFCPKPCHDGTDCGLCEAKCEVCLPVAINKLVLMSCRSLASTLAAP